MKMMQGACFCASLNKSRTREAPTPTNISTKSDPANETLAVLLPTPMTPPPPPMRFIR